MKGKRNGSVLGSQSNKVFVTNLQFLIKMSSVYH